MYFFTPNGFKRFIITVVAATVIGYAIFNIGDHFDAVLWLGGFLLTLFLYFILNTIFENDPLKQLIACSIGTIICFNVFNCFIITSFGDTIYTPFNPPPDDHSSQTYVESNGLTYSNNSTSLTYEPDTNDINTSNSTSSNEYAISMNDFSITADSSLDGYPVENLVDNDSTTTWSEGVEGSGEGQTIYFTYKVPNSEIQLKEIQITNGFIKNNEVFELNNTVENISILYNNEVIQTFVLRDSMQPGRITIPQTLTLKENDTVALRIDTVYRRQSDYVDDTCITEVSFFS